MADWPDIRESDWQLLKEKAKKRQIRTPFEAGYVQSRAAATQLKKEFAIGWYWLLRSDYDTLVTFFENNQGGSFNWDHPVTGTTFIVKFMTDELPETEAVSKELTMAGFFAGTDSVVALDGIRLEEQ